MSGLNPTSEQQKIVDACLTGADLVIEAGAGSGKTSTLKMIAGTTPRRGLYLAYNRVTKDDALASFPSLVRCFTSHGMAMGPAGRPYALRLKYSRLSAQKMAIQLGVREPARIVDGAAPMAPAALCRIALGMVKKFCYSDADEIEARHVPKVPGVEKPEERKALAAAVLPIARKMWADILNPAGQLRYEHDYYLKIFQLSRPTLDVDYMLVDEAQDLNPVVQAIVGYQKHAQVILVGDRNQSIYGWRGATDAMQGFAGERYQLSQSFRFGPAVAAEANKWLTVLDADMRLQGYDKIRSTVGPTNSPDAILARSNAAAIGSVFDAFSNGRRVALVGGGGEIARLARAAQDLQAYRPCDHPDLLAFTSWFEVQEYVSNDPSGSDLKVMVDLIDTYGTAPMLAMADRLTDEKYADVIVSTAHKAKGREWGSVRIATDFREPKPDDDGNPGEITREDAMLAYVAVTRAKTHLDRDGLAWIDRYVAAPRPQLALVDDVVPQIPETIRAGRHLAIVPETTPAAPVPGSHCRRCGSDRCICGPAEARAWSKRTGLPSGPNGCYLTPVLEVVAAAPSNVTYVPTWERSGGPGAA